MKTVRIGGVPEHFNLAWYLTLKDGSYKKKGVNLRWQDFHGGTGAMCRALRDKEIDLAVILTEGIIKDIIAGNPCKIIQVFVQSSLIWGIHVAQDSSFKNISELKGTRAAISRYGSGSHLMAYVNAKQNNWNIEQDLEFKVIKNLNGAVYGITNGEADYFLWEKFTTKPLVDEGTFRRIGNIPTPWPCFVIAAREEFIEQDQEVLHTILEIINDTTIEFKSIPSIDRTISNRYNQKLEDVQEWLSLTEWSQKNIDLKSIEDIQNQLLELNIIPKKLNYSRLVYQL
jgi:ABC-type nitrate/sulfonate/bicarbonate transport system substrate-binding protein